MFFFKQKTAYEMRISDWSSDVCSSDLAHDLGSGAGQADLLVQDLRFGEALQPEDLTRVALGVVANVQGAVSGTGQIRWDRNSVSSDGRFGTQDMSLAAAFGPVTGLSGDIHFSDLLGLETPPGQTMRMGRVNPGIEVTSGVVHYQLIKEQLVWTEQSEKRRYCNTCVSPLRYEGLTNSSQLTQKQI